MPYTGPLTPFMYPYAPTIPKEEELRMLEDEAKFLEGRLNDIRERMKELKK
jgi:hypothetical protein